MLDTKRRRRQHEIHHLWAQFHKVWGQNIDRQYVKDEWNVLRERLAELLHSLGADYHGPDPGNT
jgi:hypothetical protein